MAEGNDEGESGSHPLLSPITGLLAIVFAIMAGATLSTALSGPPEVLLVPAALAAASLGSMYFKRKLDAE